MDSKQRHGGAYEVPSVPWTFVCRHGKIGQRIETLSVKTVLKQAGITPSSVPAFHCSGSVVGLLEKLHVSLTVCLIHLLAGDMVWKRSMHIGQVP